MKMVLLSSLVVLFAIASMVAIAPNAFADHHEVTVNNAPGSSTPGCEPNCFITSTVTIPIGGTVTWANDDTAAHTSTAGSPTEGPSGAWDSSLIMVGSSYSTTLDEVGTYNYFCMVHPWMEGTVIVEDTAAAEAAAAEAAAAEAAAEAAAAVPAIDAADYIKASGADVTSITANADDNSVVIGIDAVVDGELTVTLSDKVIKAFDDGSYFVFVNNEEVEFSQTGNNLTIPYEAGNDTIEIVGSYAIPEFGTIAMIVLAVAIVSIIVITTKTRTALIPKL